jgi:hypothetical protein
MVNSRVLRGRAKQERIEKKEDYDQAEPVLDGA